MNRVDNVIFGAGIIARVNKTSRKKELLGFVNLIGIESPRLTCNPIICV